MAQATLLGFFKERLSLHAAALTFFCLLAIVPIFAIVFGIARGFGYGELLENELIRGFPEHREISQWLISFTHSLLAHVKNDFIAGVGAIALFWIVLSLFWKIEQSMNTIWKVKKGRKWTRKISDYGVMTLLCPLLFALASSATFYLASHLPRGPSMTLYEHLIYITAYIVPLLLVWLLFTSLYYWMPSCPVPFRSALIAAIVAGTLYQLLQWIFFRFQIGVSNYNAIYGSLAALPLFLLWLQSSWMVILGGAEWAYQSTILPPTRTERQTITSPLLALWFLRQLTLAFSQGVTPPSLQSLSLELGLSLERLRLVASQLESSGIIISQQSEKEERYQLARPGKSIQLHEIYRALDRERQEPLQVNAHPLLNTLALHLKLFEKEAVKVRTNLSLDELFC